MATKTQGAPKPRKTLRPKPSSGVYYKKPKEGMPPANKRHDPAKNPMDRVIGSWVDPDNPAATMSYTNSPSPKPAPRPKPLTAKQMATYKPGQLPLTGAPKAKRKVTVPKRKGG